MNDHQPPEYLEYVQKAMENSRVVLSIAEKDPLRYTGANHYALATAIHPYRGFDLFKNVGQWRGDLSASGYRAHVDYARQTLAIIRQEIDRLEAERFASGTAAPERKATGQTLAVSLALLLSTMDRLQGAQDFLTDTGHSDPDLPTLLNDLEAFTSSVDSKHVRRLFGLKPPQATPSVPPSTLRHQRKGSTPRVSRPSRPSQGSSNPAATYPVCVSFGFEDIEALQDAALLGYLDVKERWHSLAEKSQSFSRDDLGMLRLVLQDVMAAKEPPAPTESSTHIIAADPNLQGLDNHFAEILKLAPMDCEGDLVTIATEDEGDMLRLKVDSPYSP